MASLDSDVSLQKDVKQCWNTIELNRTQPSQNTNVYHMVVQYSQMFANIKHSLTVFHEHLFDVCEDSYKCEKSLCMAGHLVNLLLGR